MPLLRNLFEKNELLAVALLVGCHLENLEISLHALYTNAR
jgi:hypothetical protein